MIFRQSILSILLGLVLLSAILGYLAVILSISLSLEGMIDFAFLGISSAFILALDGWLVRKHVLSIEIVGHEITVHYPFGKETIEVKKIELPGSRASIASKAQKCLSYIILRGNWT